MNRHERALDWITTRFQLNASDWIPKLSGPGRKKDSSPGDAWLFTAAYPILSKEKFERRGLTGGSHLDYDKPSYQPVMNFYEVMNCWVSARRKAKGKPSFRGWGEFWSFLFEISIGVYDTTNWKPVEAESKPDYVRPGRLGKKDDKSDN